MRNPTQVALAQVTDLLADLAATGKCRAGDPPPLVVFDAGYDPSALAYELAARPVQILVRWGSRRVFYTDPAPRPPGSRGELLAGMGRNYRWPTPTHGPAPGQELTS